MRITVLCNKVRDWFWVQNNFTEPAPPDYRERFSSGFSSGEKYFVEDAARTTKHNFMDAKPFIVLGPSRVTETRAGTDAAIVPKIIGFGAHRLGH